MIIRVQGYEIDTDKIYYIEPIIILPASFGNNLLAEFNVVLYGKEKINFSCILPDSPDQKLFYLNDLKSQSSNYHPAFIDDWLIDPIKIRVRLTKHLEKVKNFIVSEWSKNTHIPEINIEGII